MRIQAGPWTGVDGLLAALLDGVAEGLVLLDGQGRATAMNAAAQRLLGVAHDPDGRPRSLAELLDNDPRVRTLLSRDADGPNSPVPLVRGGGGVEARLTLSLTSLRDGHRLLHVRDRTEVVDAQSHLVLLDQQLSALQSIGRVGLWNWDPATDVVEWSAGMFDIFEVQPIDFGATMEWVLGFVPEERRAGARETLSAIGAGARAEKLILPIQLSGNRVRWVESRAEVDGTSVVVGVSQDVSDREHAMRTLKEANARLERVGSAIAHDIQSSLATVLGFAQLLKLGGTGLDPDDLRERLVANAQGAIDIARSIMATVREGGQAPAATRFPLATTVDWVVERLRDGIANAGGRVVVAPDLPDVSAVEEVVRQVLVNLITNAVKYRRPGTPLRIEVGAVLADDHVVVCVTDNGLGLPPAERERVFESGYRLRRADDVEGDGVGLSSVRAALADLGQRVWLEAAPGGGTLAKFTLDR